MGRKSGFRRTPKYNLAAGEKAATRRYRVRVNADTWVELSLAIYFAVATTATIRAGLWAAVPFLMLFEVGYAYTAISTLVQAMRRRARTPSPAG